MIKLIVSPHILFEFHKPCHREIAGRMMLVIHYTEQSFFELPYKSMRLALRKLFG